MKLGKDKEQIIVWIIFGISLLLNFYNLEQLPPALHNDEAEHGLEAIRILTGRSGWIGLSQFYNVPLFGFLHQSLTIFLFGRSVFGLRAASALVGSFSLLFFFYLIKTLFDKKIALLSTVLLAFSHFWIAFSHLGINYNLSVFFNLLTFIFLIKTIKKKNWQNSLLLGVFCGSSLYLYFSSRIVPLIVAGTLVFSSLKWFSKTRLKMASLIFLGFLLAALPMLIVYVKNPHGFISRINNVFVFSPEVKPWLEDVYKTESKIKILALQARRSFNLSPQNCESSGQYGYCGRILDIPTLVFFLLGMLLALFKISHLKNFFLFFWFWTIIIFGSFLTVPPLFMPRILGALPAVYVFFSIGFYYLRNLFLKKLGNKNIRLRLLLDGVLSLVIIFVVFCNLAIYFVKYPNKIWGDPNKYTATQIGKAIRNYQNYKIVFLTKPFLYVNFSTLAYLAPETERVGVESPGDYVFETEVQKTIYVFYPQYYQKLTEAREIYPSARLIEVKVFSESQPSAYLLKID